MSVREWKVANIFIWSGIWLLLIGIWLNYPLFQPYFASLIKTRELVTAPPLGAAVVQANAETPLASPSPPVKTATKVPAATTRALATSEEATTQLDVSPTASPVSPPTVTSAPPTPTPTRSKPQYIRIPTIGLAAPIVPVTEKELAGPEAEQTSWTVPDWRAVGWHASTSWLGERGNTVLNGHNTTRGEVFRDLYQIEEGARILLTGEDQRSYAYTVTNIYILAEYGQTLAVRQQNAQYIQATTDERVTLVTCHPYASTRYRLIVIAKPVTKSSLAAEIGE